MQKKQFVEKLSKYIDLDEFVKLNRDSFSSLKKFFDEHRIFEKMGHKHNAVTGMSRFENLLSDCSKYLDAQKNNESILKELEKTIDMPKTSSDINNYVVFYYFIFRENNLIKPDADNETLFQFLANTYGYKMYHSYFVKKEEFILFCALRWKSNIKQFSKFLSEEWCCDSIGDLEAIIESDSEITVGKFIERINELCTPMDTELNVRSTRNSVAQASENIELIRQDNIGAPEDDESFISFCNHHPEYAQILRTIQNTEPRRRWYLYRILQKIIIKQIEYINSTCRNVKEMTEVLNVKGVLKATMANPFVVLEVSGDNKQQEKANLVFNYLFFFGLDYAECNRKLTKAKEAENKNDFNLATKIILEFYEEMGENVYKINSEMIGKLRTYYKEKQLDDELRKIIDKILTAYEEKIKEKDLQDFILNNCYMRIGDIAYIFEVVFDDKALHQDNEQEVRIARLTDDWVRRCIVRGMNDSKILEIANENQVMISNKIVDQARIDATRMYLKEHCEQVLDSNGDKGHGFGIRTDSEPGQLFKKVLVGEANVSKEMLLSFVLLAKAYSVNAELSWDYIRFHILENARFDRNAEDGTSFNIFFALTKNALDEDDELENLLKRADYLSEKACDMELSYLEKGIAPFAVMFSGGDLD